MVIFKINITVDLYRKYIFFKAVVIAEGRIDEFKGDGPR